MKTSGASKKIPTGNYCYGYVPAPGFGFPTMAEVDAYVESLPEDDRWPEWLRLARSVKCPYWRYIGHGRVRCKMTGLVAVCWGSRCEHLARVFYRKHGKAREREKGWLIGDAVKECDYNRDGWDFSFRSDPRNVVPSTSRQVGNAPAPEPAPETSESPVPAMTPVSATTQ